MAATIRARAWTKILRDALHVFRKTSAASYIAIRRQRIERRRLQR